MKTLRLESHRVNLHLLSPIHIGTGQELDPFSYVIKDNKLILIDLVKWVEIYPEKEKLQRAMDSDNFAETRAFIAAEVDPDGVSSGSIPVESSGLVRTYNKVIRAKDPRNQLLIDGMTRNEISQVPYIPGSSIKGAIRTAIANHFVKKAGVTAKNKKKTYQPAFEPDYNEKIFGRINKDPMRYLKLADIALDRFGSMIVEAEEYPLNENKSKTPKGYKEVSANLCQTGKPVVYPLRLSLRSFALHGEDVDLSFIIDALYRFYVPKYKEEYNKFYSLTRANLIKKAIAPMSLEIARLRTNETLVRLGHFSHVECVTLDDVRDPQTRTVNHRRMPYGTTRTLANGLYPFGWAKLEFPELESTPRRESHWPFSIADLEKVIEANKESVEKAMKAARAAQALIREEEAKRLADENRRKKRKLMTPEERSLYDLQQPDVTENRVYEIYRTLDDLSGEDQRNLALALKRYWLEKDNAPRNSG